MENKIKITDFNESHLNKLTIVTGSDLSMKNQIPKRSQLKGRLLNFLECPRFVPQNYTVLYNEPEKYYSPENQILIAHEISRELHNGSRILLITHCDYILKELNNVIMLHGLHKKNREKFISEHYEYKDIKPLNPDHVTLYYCQGGILTKQKDADKFGLYCPYLDNIIDRINKISDNLSFYV